MLSVTNILIKTIKTMENKVKVWLARDKDGELYAYSDIPVRFTRFWSQAPYITLGKPIFPSI